MLSLFQDIFTSLCTKYQGVSVMSYFTSLWRDGLIFEVCSYDPEIDSDDAIKNKFLLSMLPSRL